MVFPVESRHHSCRNYGALFDRTTIEIERPEITLTPVISHSAMAKYVAKKINQIVITGIFHERGKDIPLLKEPNTIEDLVKLRNFIEDNYPLVQVWSNDKCIEQGKAIVARKYIIKITEQKDLIAFNNALGDIHLSEGTCRETPICVISEQARQAIKSELSLLELMERHSSSSNFAMDSTPCCCTLF